MKAAVLEGPGAGLVVRDIDIAEPIGREVLVDIKASGLCHSDLHMIKNPAGFPAAVVLGHEASGVVVAVGPDVTEFEVGDHVVGCLVSHCGRCERCTTGRPYQCRNAAETARAPEQGARLSVEGAPVIQFWSLGAFAEQMLVHENALVKIREDMPLDRAALIGCSVMTGVGAAIHTSNVRPGETVAVIGCGGVGDAAIAGAQLAGATTIIAIDIDDRKLEQAKRFGATHTVNSAAQDPVEAVRALTGGNGVDVVVDAVGRPETYQQAFQLRDLAGTVVLVGVPNPEATVELPLAEVFGRGGALKSSWYGDCLPERDFPMLIDLYRQGRFDLDGFVSERIGLGDVESAFEKMHAGDVLRSVVVW